MGLSVATRVRFHVRILERTLYSVLMLVPAYIRGGRKCSAAGLAVPTTVFPLSVPVMSLRVLGRFLLSLVFSTRLVLWILAMRGRDVSPLVRQVLILCMRGRQFLLGMFLGVAL